MSSSLSTIGCVLVFVTYYLFKDLHTFPAKIVVHYNIAITILPANVLQITSIGEANLIPVRVEGARCKLLVYSAVGWAIPLVIVAVVQYGANPRWREGVCWIA